MYFYCMKIKVLLFGIIKDLINENSLEIELSDSSNISDFKVLIFANYSILKSHQNFAVAVNEVYEEDNYFFKTGDVIALIPPVSGG